MKKVSLFIAELDFPKDFTIFYKGIDELKEIKTSKDEFLKKLRFFKSQNNEIQHQNEIFIHENYSFKVFNDFITSIETKEIIINTDNYSDLYDLSNKYQYLELKQQVEQFIKERPDLNQIIRQLSEDPNNQKSEDISNFSKAKEDIISENLDFCLQNSLLNTIPYPILIRIINSPKQKLNNRHLLFNFIIEKMKTMKKNSNSNQAESEEEQAQYTELLKSSLDLNEMNEDELNELFENRFYSTKLNSKFNTEKYSVKNKINKIESQFEYYDRIIEGNKQKIEEQNKIIKQLTSKIEQMNENTSNEIEEMREKMISQQEEISELKEQYKKERKNRKNEMLKMQQQNTKEIDNMKDESLKVNKQIKENISNINISISTIQKDILKIKQQFKEKICITINESFRTNRQVDKNIQTIQNYILKIKQSMEKYGIFNDDFIHRPKEKEEEFEVMDEFEDEDDGKYDIDASLYGQNDSFYLDKRKSLPSFAVLVKNIPYSATAKDIGVLLNSQIGDIKDVRIASTKFRGRIYSRGFGFVEFRAEEATKKALAMHYVNFRAPKEAASKCLEILPAIPIGIYW